MVKKTKKKSLGAWAFLIGVLLALILGLFSAQLGGSEDVILWILVVLGLIVGLLNVSGDETNRFIIAGLALIIAAALGGSAMGIGILGSILSALLVLFVPATIIVALKSVFDIAKD